MLEQKKSTHVCEVVPVVLEKHPNADKLSIVNIYGYQCVVETGYWRENTRGAFIVPDSLVDTSRPEFAFLAADANSEGKYRVKAKKIRKVVSYGLLVPVPESIELGTDLAEALGVTRYEPPEWNQRKKKG